MNEWTHAPTHAPTHAQTNKQTNKQTNRIKRLTPQYSKSPGNDVFSLCWDLGPLLIWEVVFSGHNLFSHALRQLFSGNFWIEWWVTTQHDVDNHSKRPHITALGKIGHLLVNKFSYLVTHSPFFLSFFPSFLPPSFLPSLPPSLPLSLVSARPSILILFLHAHYLVISVRLRQKRKPPWLLCSVYLLRLQYLPRNETAELYTGEHAHVCQLKIHSSVTHTQHVSVKNTTS